MGQWRQRVWQNNLNLNGADAELALWERRAIEYWALQGYKYGILFDLEHTENYLQGDRVLSRARVLGVLKGQRIPEKEWRKINPPGRVIAQLGFDTNG